MSLDAEPPACCTRCRQQLVNARKAEVVDLRLVSSRGRGVLTKHTGVLSMCDVELVGIAVTHFDRTQKSMSRMKRSPRMKRVGNRDSEWSWRRVARPRFRRDSNHVVRRTTRICAWAPCVHLPSPAWLISCSRTDSWQTAGYSYYVSGLHSN